MSKFAFLRAELGLAIPDVARDFRVTEADVRCWEIGDQKAPSHVVRTLELLRCFQVGETSAYGRAEQATHTRYPQKCDETPKPSVDVGLPERHHPMDMEREISGDMAMAVGAGPRAGTRECSIDPRKLRLLDLFCCAGGAAVGYARAGFEVVGIDIVPRPSFPFEFIQADAMRLSLEFISSFDAIHASPPCQSYSDLAKRNANGHKWPRLIEPVRKMLKASGKPYVIENVEGAPLLDPVVLCGTMFPGLRVIRHRLFEANFPITPRAHKRHPKVHTFDKRKSHFGKTDEWKDFVQVTGGGNCTLAAARDAMGIDWMTKGEINEAIPPAYTQFIGEQLAAYIHALEEREEVLAAA